MRLIQKKILLAVRIISNDKGLAHKTCFEESLWLGKSFVLMIEKCEDYNKTLLWGKRVCSE